MATAPRVVVVGTAGHVDHGKSRLVQALSGTDPDRLAEEKARGLTIDLGFAWRSLPGGAQASFVDVPGHEDFIHNMLAGAGGVDAALLVVAADEGPMPQTREHLAILDLLAISNAIAVITKIDLVDDAWLELVHAEVLELLSGTELEHSPILAVSAQTGAGMDELVASLDELAGVLPPPADHDRPRLSVDRSFSMSGFGTVVTGTLRDGCLRPGDVLERLPDAARTRVRGLQTHGHAIDLALPGSRVALNLAGIEARAMARGEVLALPGTYTPTRLVDVALRLVADAPAALAHDERVQLFHGAAQIEANVRIIGDRQIAPGEHGFAQLRLASPTVLAAGDRFVLRRPSPSATLGGGVVLDARPRARRRRFRPETLARFRALAHGDPPEVAWHMLAEREPCRVEALYAPDTGLEPAVRDAALGNLARTGRAVTMGELWLTDAGWSALAARAQAVLGAYHRRYPLRAGPPPEELRGRLGLTSEAFAALVAAGVAGGWLAHHGEALGLASHQVRLSPADEAAAAALLGRFRAAPFTPPSAHDAEAAVGASLLAALVDRGELVAVGGDVLFDRSAYETLLAAVEVRLASHGRVTVADVRDEFATSRKYALALLEDLDRKRVTRRDGDAHVPARGSPGMRGTRPAPAGPGEAGQGP